MIAKAKDSDMLQRYRDSDPEERFGLLMDNYGMFPKMIRKFEKKIEYKIKAERKYAKSKRRGELGVRVQTSDLSDPTSSEAIVSVTIQEGFQSGDLDKSIIKGLDNAREYEEEVRIIGIMRMDFKLLEEIIEDLDNDESTMMKKYLLEGMTLRQIAADEGLSYDAMKKKHLRIREEIKEEVMECFEMSHEFTAVHMQMQGGEDDHESNE